MDPDQRPSAHEIYNQLIECAAGLVDLSPSMQPNLESRVLCALAITPVPFSSETQSFINARQIIYQQQLEDAKNDGFSLMTSLVSRFHTRTQLKQITERHSRTALVILGQQPNIGK